MKKILIGMSGGVDSSAAAVLLLQQGYDVSGCTLKLFEGTDSSVNDAKEVCDKLGIEHHVIDIAPDFRREVMDKFADSYINGETPSSEKCLTTPSKTASTALPRDTTHGLPSVAADTCLPVRMTYGKTRPISSTPSVSTSFPTAFSPCGIWKSRKFVPLPRSTA